MSETEKRQVLIDRIEGITAQLKGSGIASRERLLLNADRHDMRREVAAIDARAALSPQPDRQRKE